MPSANYWFKKDNSNTLVALPNSAFSAFHDSSISPSICDYQGTYYSIDTYETPYIQNGARIYAEYNKFATYISSISINVLYDTIKISSLGLSTASAGDISLKIKNTIGTVLYEFSSTWSSATKTLNLPTTYNLALNTIYVVECSINASVNQGLGKNGKISCSLPIKVVKNNSKYQFIIAGSSRTAYATNYCPTLTQTNILSEEWTAVPRVDAYFLFRDLAWSII